LKILFKEIKFFSAIALFLTLTPTFISGFFPHAWGQIYWFIVLLEFTVIALRTKEIPKIETLITKKRVATLPLNTLLKQKDVESPDLLLVDTEGHDDKIIKMFPFQKYRPELVIFEHKHLTKNKKRSICKKITNYGYSIQETNTDIVALKNKSKKNK
jgi:hypothetical protein